MKKCVKLIIFTAIVCLCAFAIYKHIKGLNYDVTDYEDDSGPTYGAISLGDMMEAYENNVNTAKNRYVGNYYELSGILRTVAPSGDFITIYCDKWSYNSMTCYVKDDAQRDVLSKYKRGDTITLRVKIKSVYDKVGYSANIMEIVE